MLFFHDGSLAVLGYNGGSVDGDVWTSTNGDFILTNNVEGRGIGYTNLAGSQDGFKLNHTDSYTLKVSEDIKVTKLVVVGKSWLKSENGNNASTIAFDDFTPASATFYDYPTDGETYVKTAEFTPASELDYGASITMRPGNNQLGAYIEVYGVKRSGPADPKIGEATITYVGGSLSNNTWTGTGDCEGYTFSGETLTQKNSTGKFKAVYGTDSKSYTITVPNSVAVSAVTIKAYGENDGSVVTIGENNYTYNKNNEEADTHTFSIASPSAGNSIVFSVATKNLIIESITLSSDDITLTTTDKMAGWRAFYDADNSYSVDENTTVYVAASEPENGKITLTSIEGIPAGVPVILHTTSSADSYKMTLTKATVDGYNGTNLLEWATSAVNNVYRLGYGADGVGFYPYSGTPTSGAVILNVSSANAGGAKALTFSFGDVTAISNAAAAEAANAGTGKMYNLSGQIVGEGYKGIVIVNGKKVIK